MKKLILLLIILTGLSFFSFTEAVKIKNPLNVDTFDDLIDAIAGIIELIVGSLAVLMLIIAAIYFITAAGDLNQISQAKTMVKYAIIGVIIASMARAIGTVVESLLKTAP